MKPIGLYRLKDPSPKYLRETQKAFYRTSRAKISIQPEDKILLQRDAYEYCYLLDGLTWYINYDTFLQFFTPYIDDEKLLKDL